MTNAPEATMIEAHIAGRQAAIDRRAVADVEATARHCLTADEAIAYRAGFRAETRRIADRHAFDRAN